MPHNYLNQANCQKNPPQSNLKISLVEKEERFHSISCFFGDALEEEIELVVPAMQKDFQQRAEEDEVLDFLLKLGKKMGELLKFKNLIFQKVEKGEINEEKYREILTRALNKNKEMLVLSRSENMPANNSKRIERRIFLCESELNKFQANKNAINESKMI